MQDYQNYLGYEDDEDDEDDDDNDRLDKRASGASSDELSPRQRIAAWVVGETFLENIYSMQLHLYRGNVTTNNIKIYNI